ncbi:MAG: hypothetical protein MZV63_20615 [Marinilabiliales bacterium]|nr:hypothetical protein [Marinilabiliales bacterium]
MTPLALRTIKVSGDITGGINHLASGSQCGVNQLSQSHSAALADSNLLPSGSLAKSNRSTYIHKLTGTVTDVLILQPECCWHTGCFIEEIIKLDPC